MYRIGDQELRAVARLFKTQKLFRYGKRGECEKFEARWAKHVGVKHARLTSSGTGALEAALIGAGIGPGDEVIVPSYTYMATALAVLRAGAIPVVADIDESLTLSPEGVVRRLTDRTRAMLPAHLQGLPCDMNALCRIATKHKLLIVEDACQAVGGAYEGKRLGSFGVSAGFSFNFYKNITSGEGGAFVTNQKKVFDRGSVAVDCCAFYWDEGPQQDDVQFAGGNYRINEISGAILNVQLSRLDPMLKRMRRNKKRLLSVGLRAGLRSIVNNSLDHECGTNLGFIFDTEREARDFAAGLKKKKVGAFLPIDTGRHFYTRWEPIIRKQGAHHPALDPFRLKENRGSRVDYSEKLCERSLDIVQRAVLLPMNPDHTQKDRDRIAAAIRAAG